MLIVRREQIEILERESWISYISGLIPHVREHFPGHCEDLEDPQLFQALMKIGARARDHGFTTERDVCLFADLSVMLGSGFDTDPQLPWAATILNDGLVRDSRLRMDKLWDKAMEYMGNILGPDEEFPVRACEKAMQSLPVSGIGNEVESMESGIIGLMKEIWPEKVDYVRVSQLSVFIDSSLAHARRSGLLRSEGQADFVIVAFLLGHQFDKDPLYPWIQEILMRKQQQPEDRPGFNDHMARLRSAFSKWLERRRKT